MTKDPPVLRHQFWSYDFVGFLIVGIFLCYLSYLSFTDEEVVSLSSRLFSTIFWCAIGIVAFAFSIRIAIAPYIEIYSDFIVMRRGISNSYIPRTLIKDMEIKKTKCEFMLFDNKKVKLDLTFLRGTKRVDECKSALHEFMDHNQKDLSTTSCSPQ